VGGSFVANRAGELLLADMPAHFEASSLALIARRLARLLSCGSANGVAAEEAMLDFGKGRLLVREYMHGYLCVLCSPQVSLKSLRLTARLVARAMPAELGALATERTAG
jgi:hypothetical protein